LLFFTDQAETKITMSNETKELNNYELSLTKANKLLSRLRNDAQSDVQLYGGQPNKYLQPTTGQIITVVKGLGFDRDNVEKQHNDVYAMHKRAIIRKQLIEKIKKHIFIENISKGISDIMSEMECLNYESNNLKKVLATIAAANVCSLLQVINDIHDIPANHEKRFDISWNTSTFDVDRCRNRIEEIATRVNELDEQKDKLNINNTFSIKLSNEEKAILNL
jgi:hypothetical protein